ncbi:hypothetical protein GCM10027515_33030 [Schumannella luteola]|uniref:Uncharacterized protein n=1 Tax=Schumannella luteola TaxID=472059 RepID=A0A852YGF5_9MICO|nr:hypothetical protein [Schumannella luteola]NYG98897.1 hypothetical protein [Schumannella luteola]TPX06277.1 hypothetical protein FJ656_01130 [Schumannella luteola]
MARRTDHREPARPPTPTALALRPFGYLGAALAWAALAALGVMLYTLLPSMIEPPLSSAPGLRVLGVDVGETIAFVIGMGLGAIMIGFLLLVIPLAAGGLAILSLTYVVRSLRPAYRGERLSMTRWDADAIGPVRLGGTLLTHERGPLRRFSGIGGGVALSLLPVRQTRWSAFWSVLVVSCFTPGFRTVLSSGVWGVAYLVTVGWMAWPVPAGSEPIWVGVSVVLGVAALVLVGLSWRHSVLGGRDADAGTTGDAGVVKR